MNTQKSKYVISRSPDVMSGAAVFVGTRVPVQTLLDYLAGGHKLNEFLDDFPTVTRDQVERVEGVYKFRKLRKLFKETQSLAGSKELTDEDIFRELQRHRDKKIISLPKS